MTQDIVHVTAATSLHGYKAWRESLTALPEGTIITWVDAYQGCSLGTSVKAGQSYKIKRCRAPMLSNSQLTCDMIYDMVLVSANGREYKKMMGWSVEQIARGLHLGSLMSK